MSSFPKFTIKQMLECGVHFGHKRMLWNPKMASYIYCERNGVHIINLQKTAELLHSSLHVLYQLVKKNPKAKVLFVGTKHQASPLIKKYAMSCGQFFVNHRWLGGMLTNWGTVSKSIQKISEYEGILLEASSATSVKYNKKELLDIDRSRDKLEKSLGGIRDMRQKPDLVFVIDTNKEKIAIQEAKKLGIPVMAILDTNANIDNIDYPIPGNDDSSKSIDFYCDMVSQAILAGLADSLVESGVDPNEAQDRVREAIAKDIRKAEEKRVDFSKVQEAKESLEKAKMPKKRVIEVSEDLEIEVVKDTGSKNRVVISSDSIKVDTKKVKGSVEKSVTKKGSESTKSVKVVKKPAAKKVETEEKVATKAKLSKKK
jgi:small subunit ribosomal protein S2